MNFKWNLCVIVSVCNFVLSGVRVFPVTTMASFKPTKIQVYPKLGEKVTQDTLYWKNYKVNIFYF